MATEFISVEKEPVKETVFEYYFDTADGWMQTTLKPSDFEKVVYLGKCPKDGDMFAAYNDRYIDIYKGVKGGEFND